MRIKKGLVEMRVTKREREGPRARSAYPIPAATVIIIPLSLSAKSIGITPSGLRVR